MHFIASHRRPVVRRAEQDGAVIRTQTRLTARPHRPHPLASPRFGALICALCALCTLVLLGQGLRFLVEIIR